MFYAGQSVYLNASIGNPSIPALLNSLGPDRLKHVQYLEVHVKYGLHTQFIFRPHGNNLFSHPTPSIGR